MAVHFTARSQPYCCKRPGGGVATQKPCKVFQPGSIPGRASRLRCFAAPAQQAPCAKAIASKLAERRRTLKPLWLASPLRPAKVARRSAERKDGFFRLFRPPLMRRLPFPARRIWSKHPSRAGLYLCASPRDARQARPFFVPGILVIPGRPPISGLPRDRRLAGPGIQTQARCQPLDSGFAASRRPGMTKGK